MAVSLRILDETKIDLEQARHRLGTADQPLHYVTVIRLIHRGLKMPDGSRVYLDHLRLGGKLVTSTEAIARFAAATNGIDPGDPSTLDPSDTPAPTKARLRELEHVDRELDASGIGTTPSGPRPRRGRRAAAAK